MRIPIKKMIRNMMKMKIQRGWKANYHLIVKVALLIKKKRIEIWNLMHIILSQ
jgi:hypothetical protein